MNHRLLLLLALLPLTALLTGCDRSAPKQAARPAAPTPAKMAMLAVPKDAIRGDFDGDGVPEYVWLVPPRLTADEQDCVGNCIAYLTCSNPAIRPYGIKQAIGGTLTKFSHLDASGRDYVGVLPEWFTSCWAPYYLLECPGRAWQPALPSFSTHCNQWEAGTVPVEPDPARPGNVLVHYSGWDQEDIVTKTKSVALKLAQK
ncbi:MAG: hypothetical protein ACRYFX_26235 [Janthinobacterium lividum]